MSAHGISGARLTFNLPPGVSWKDRPVMPSEREKLTAGIVADLVELPDEALRILRGLVAEVKAAEIARGTSRKLDGATLAREQAAREAGGFGCHHEPVCESACPVPSFPPVEEADDAPREALITLLDLHDAAGERLRVEHDGDDGRSFVVLGEPDAETAFELGPDAGTRIVGALSDLPAPRGAGVRSGGVQASEAVKQGMAPEKPTCPHGEPCMWCGPFRLEVSP